jgi:predicted nucleic acid-binding protein
MNAEVFVDTNVVLYAVSSAPKEAGRAQAARRILGEEDFGLSTQVLSEFFVNATRKIATPLSDQEALEFVEILCAAPVVAVDVDIVVQAVGFKARYGLSYWDAAIIAAAHALGATTLYTEDLNDGQTYGAVRAVNPFVHAAEADTR